MKSWLPVLLTLALVVLLVAGVWLWTSKPAELADDRDDATQVAIGARLYAEHCASCHGVDLEGQPNWQQRRPDGKLPAPPHDATGHTWHHPDGQIFAITKHGLRPYAPRGYASDMPAYADRLGDGEIWAVLAFIKNTWPPEIRRRQSESSRGSDNR